MEVGDSAGEGDDDDPDNIDGAYIVDGGNSVNVGVDCVLQKCCAFFLVKFPDTISSPCSSTFLPSVPIQYGRFYRLCRSKDLMYGSLPLVVVSLVRHLGASTTFSCCLGSAFCISRTPLKENHYPFLYSLSTTGVTLYLEQVIGWILGASFQISHFTLCSDMSAMSYYELTLCTFQDVLGSLSIVACTSCVSIRLYVLLLYQSDL
ncbi:hypothetical protein Tsubulata_050333 [Turnera subulata]|uniref:Uncharacterized protein n=1 Tax=Turnera subulata TaxID=218843 RepID=A0A9Q0FSL7_9ROSI|nr:hypothetical protein Tsubulata_050333 [Turnera subulata]